MEQRLFFTLILNYPNNVPYREKIYPDFIMNWLEHDPKEVLKISSEVLSNNLNISSKGESLYNQYLINKRVLTVGDTISDKEEILTWEDAKRKYS